MKILTLCLLVVICVLPIVADGREEPGGRVHNTVSVGQSMDEAVCLFCHLPDVDQSGGTLWNSPEASSFFTVYARPGDDALQSYRLVTSKQCLGCHDGIMAFNSLLFTPDMDLSSGENHPTAIVYSTYQNMNPTLRPVTMSDSGPVISDGQITLPLFGSSPATATMECISCHDPHMTDNIALLRVPNMRSQLCFTCHMK